MFRVGALGRLHLSTGYYMYTGRHRKSLKKRLLRHLSNHKKNYWHIDYITSDPAYQNVTTIDIFVEKSPFGLYNLPCKVVHDRIIKRSKVNSEVIDLLATRRCGIKFGPLGKEKEKQLEKFISVYTDKFAKCKY